MSSAHTASLLSSILMWQQSQAIVLNPPQLPLVSPGPPTSSLSPTSPFADTPDMLRCHHEPVPVLWLCPLRCEHHAGLMTSAQGLPRLIWDPNLFPAGTQLRSWASPGAKVLVSPLEFLSFCPKVQLFALLMGPKQCCELFCQSTVYAEALCLFH